MVVPFFAAVLSCYKAQENTNPSCMGMFANTLAVYCCWLLSSWKRKSHQSSLITNGPQKFLVHSQNVYHWTKSVYVQYFCKVCIMEKMQLRSCKKYLPSTMPYKWTTYRKTCEVYRLNAGQKQNMITFISDTALL